MTAKTQRTRAIVRILAASVVVLVGARVAVAQDAAATNVQGTAASKVIVDLGSADGPAGRTLSVPLNIAVPEGVRVSEFEVEVKFDKALLTFTKSELAPQGKADAVKITTAVADDPADSKKSILRLKAAAGGALGSGAIVDLFFRIDPKAKPPAGSKDKLLPGTSHTVAKFGAPLEKVARVRVDGGQLVVAGGRDGRIDITEGVALFGCFFYMH